MDKNELCQNLNGKKLAERLHQNLWLFRANFATSHILARKLQWSEKCNYARLKQ